jgi:hypothetical protein
LGETDYVFELFVPEMMITMENHGEIIQTGENPCFVHQSSLAIMPANI